MHFATTANSPTIECLGSVHLTKLHIPKCEHLDEQHGTCLPEIIDPIGMDSISSLNCSSSHMAKKLCTKNIFSHC